MADFYKTKEMSQFSDEEWEMICMRCGKCCMNKYGDETSVIFSNLMCRNFDLKRSCCSCYENRLSSSCVKVDLELLKNNINLLPHTCAYRLLYEGKGLPEFHPLITEDVNSVIKARETVAFLDVFSEKDLSDALMDLHEREARENWDEEKFEKEEAKIFDKFKIKPIYIYPLVPKK